jgi:uncharacterized protein (TIGR02284 family)
MHTTMNPAMEHLQECDTDTLNSLLRGEISAVETYQQAIEKFEGRPEVGDLRRIRDQHSEAASLLRERVVHYGGEPSESSSIWGAFAALVTGTAKLFGPGTAISALRRGEDHGIAVYEDAIKGGKLADECRSMVETQLLPACRRHIQQLDQMNAALS